MIVRHSASSDEKVAAPGVEAFGGLGVNPRMRCRRRSANTHSRRAAGSLAVASIFWGFRLSSGWAHWPELLCGRRAGGTSGWRCTGDGARLSAVRRRGPDPCAADSGDVDRGGLAVHVNVRGLRDRLDEAREHHDGGRANGDQMGADRRHHAARGGMWAGAAQTRGPCKRRRRWDLRGLHLRLLPQTLHNSSRITPFISGLLRW